MSDARTNLNLAYNDKIKAKVRAINAIGEGDFSNVTTDSNAANVETVPNAPSSVTSSNIQTNQVTISWS